MSWVWEVACCGAPDLAGAVRDWFDRGPARHWPGLAGLRGLDLYVPARGRSHDPYVDDGAGPLALAILELGTEHELAAAAPGLAGALAGRPAGMSLTADAFERRFYPVAAATAPAPLAAPFSYVVRYHRPAEDEAAFVRNYVDSHPPTLALLPGIRNVMCYFPLALERPAGVPGAGYMIGNEVVFDRIEDFNAAMASPVRQELRRHYNEFPPFSGPVTHYPMERTRLVG